MTGTARRIARPLSLLLALCASAASATPNVPLEDPVYLQLEQLRAQGKLPAYLGGARPLTEAEIQRLLTQAGAAPDPKLLAPEVSSAWLRPATLVTLRGSLIDEHLDVLQFPQDRDTLHTSNRVRQESESWPLWPDFWPLVESPLRPRA